MAFVLPARIIKALVPPAAGPIDPDALAITSYLLTTGCESLMLGATSDTKGAQLVLNVHFFDSKDVYIGSLRRLVLVAGALPEIGPLFASGLDNGAEPTFHCGPSDKAIIQVLSVTPATATFTLSAAAR